MANCNTIFGEFNKLIRLNDQRRETLKEKRDDLRNRIYAGYNVVKDLEGFKHTMDFQSQGSYVMDTIINPSNADDQYDIDDGLYIIGELSREKRPTPKAFHDWIIKLIEAGKSDFEIEEIKDKDTCVRVIYKGRNGDLNYHVDLPSYYAINKDEPDLANKKDGWHLSNPIEFIVWFEKLIESGFKKEYILEFFNYKDEYHNWLTDIRKRDHQLRRIVRYLKAWGDLQRGEMPPGIIMTILAGENYVEDERDDVSLLKTLQKINKYLNENGFKCFRPTNPCDEDLFENYTTKQKKYFEQALESFIDSGEQAISHSNLKNACMKWQKHLGMRFPCSLIEDEIEDAKSHASPAAIKSDNSKSA